MLAKFAYICNELKCTCIWNSSILVRKTIGEPRQYENDSAQMLTSQVYYCIAGLGLFEKSYMKNEMKRCFYQGLAVNVLS